MNIFLKLFSGLLILFLVVFPKGGIKVNEIPITHGYILLGLAATVSGFINLSRGKLFLLNKNQIIIFFCLLGFLTIASLSILFNGFSYKQWVISFYVSLALMPVIFLYILLPQITQINLDEVLKRICQAVFIVSIYGIFLFFYKITTGSFIEIPYLTVNVADVGTLEGKYISRGEGLFKLISTYNNGNIYGVCILMLLPLYDFIERSRWKSSIVQMSILLTLSRTAWAGLFMYHFIKKLYINKITVKQVLKWMLSLFIFAVVITYTVYYFNLGGADFVFDEKLGGRNQFFDDLEITFFPSKEYSSIYEMAYLAALDMFGIVGLILFLFAMTSPVALYLLGKTPVGNIEYRKSILLGLLIYLFVATSDGVMLYIPTMVFYWFLVALLITKNFIQPKTIEIPYKKG